MTTNSASQSSPSPGPSPPRPSFHVRWPAEWEPHQACLILYPHNPNIFRSNCQYAQAQVRRVAQCIAQHGDEDVVLFCRTEQERTLLQQKLRQEDNEDSSSCRSSSPDVVVLRNSEKKPRPIHVLVCSSVDTWARDTGPTFVRVCNSDKPDASSTATTTTTTRLLGLDWDFNGYGGPDDGCYWPCELDKAICGTMCRDLSRLYHIPIPTRSIPLILEGGSIHTDGQGTILTTEECLLHANRNPGLTKSQIETTLMEHLGCRKVIWIPFGLAADDDTNGHVDNMACFVRPTEILVSWTDDETNDPENYRRCRAAWDVLKHETDARGRSLVVHKLQLPPPMYYTEQDLETLTPHKGVVLRQVGQRLAASYVNFYMANACVVVPQFGVEPCDGQAIATLESLVSSQNHVVVGVPSREILLGGGNIHCITQQMPNMPLP